MVLGLSKGNVDSELAVAVEGLGWCNDLVRLGLLPPPPGENGEDENGDVEGKFLLTKVRDADAEKIGRVVSACNLGRIPPIETPEDETLDDADVEGDADTKAERGGVAAI